MQSWKIIKLVVVIGLVPIAFLAGRSSVNTPELKVRDATSKPAGRRVLSGLSNASHGASANTPVGRTTAPGRPPAGLQETIDAENIAATLASAAAELDDFEGLSELIAAWLEKNPDQVIAWLASGDSRDGALRAIFAIWGRSDPEAAGAWIAANPNLAGYESAAFGLALALADSGQSAPALVLAGQLSDPLYQSKIWLSAGVDLYRSDPDLAVERLADTGMPDEFQALAIEHWRSNIMNERKRNAQNLASVYSSAIAAGAAFEGASSAEIVREMVAGVNGNDSYKDTTFQVPNLSEAEIAGALEYLDFIAANQPGAASQLNYR